MAKKKNNWLKVKIAASNIFGYNDGKAEIYISGNKQNLSEKQLHLLAYASPFLVMTEDCVDSTLREEDTEDTIADLKEWWGVTDRETALETMEWLFAGGHRIKVDEIRKLIKTYPSEEIRAILSVKEDPSNWEKRYENILEMETYIQDKMPVRVTQTPATIAAYDYIRAANLAILFLQTGYISEEEMWEYIQRSASLSARTFSSWEEFGESFAFGRGCWQGDTEDYDLAIEIIQLLLTDPDSPWKKYPIRTEELLKPERLFKTDWNIGEKKTFTLSLDTFCVEKQDIKEDCHETYRIEIEVIDNNEGIKTISWKYQPVAPGQGNTWISVFMRELMGHTQSPGFIYKIDPDGSFIELVNYPGLYDFLESIRGWYCNQYSQPEYAEQWEQVKKCFSTPSMFQQYFMPHIDLFHSLYGTRWSESGEQSSHHTVTGNAGIGELDVTTTSKVTIDDTENRLTYHLESGYTPQAPGETHNFSIQDTLDGKYLLPSFWPSTLRFKRITKHQELYKKEEIVIEMNS